MFPRVFSHHHSPLKPQAATKPTKSLIHYPRNGLLCLPKRRDLWYSVLVHGNGEWYMYITSTMPGFRGLRNYSTKTDFGSILLLLQSCTLCTMLQAVGESPSTSIVRTINFLFFVPIIWGSILDSKILGHIAAWLWQLRQTSKVFFFCVPQIHLALNGENDPGDDSMILQTRTVF